jgi:hypothetical protein
MKKFTLFIIMLICAVSLNAQYGYQTNASSVSVIEVIAGIIGIIAIITFFYMAMALKNISEAIRNTNRIVSAWSKETGIGLVKPIEPPLGEKTKYQSRIYDTNKGKLEIQSTLEAGFSNGDCAFIAGKMAPDGRYKLGFMWSVYVKDGKIIQQ